MPVKTKLQNVTSTLHELIMTLPAVKARCNAEALKQHLQLIAYFQHQYDLLAGNTAAASPV